VEIAKEIESKISEALGLDRDLVVPIDAPGPGTPDGAPPAPALDEAA
jgi:hypothetical protein